MRDIISILERWTAEGTAVALGSVIERIGSAPRDPGRDARRLGAGEVAGVGDRRLRRAGRDPRGDRGAERLAAAGSAATGSPTTSGFDVGLTCGGSIAVAVYALDPQLVGRDRRGGREPTRPVAMTVRLDEERFGEQTLVRGDSPRETATLDRARAVAARARRERRSSRPADGELVFVESYAPRPEHVHLRRERPRHRARARWASSSATASPSATRARRSSPRSASRTPTSSSIEWPDRFLETAPVDPRTAICMMTHDLKFDVPALQGASGHERRLHRRDRQREDPHRARAAAARRGHRRGRPRPAPRPDRHPDRRPHARGGRGHDRRAADRGERDRPRQAHRLDRPRDRPLLTPAPDRRPRRRRTCDRPDLGAGGVGRRSRALAARRAAVRSASRPARRADALGPRLGRNAHVRRGPRGRRTRRAESTYVASA